MALPPLGEYARERACSRLLGYHADGSENVCGKPPVVHIAWSFDPDGVEQGWACEEHRQEALDRWKPVGHHPVQECCGMPGARWSEQEKRCRFDGDLPVAEPVRTISLPEPVEVPSARLREREEENR